MSAVNSTMLELGTKAPGFSLPDTDGNTVSLDDFKDADGLLVMFICNHCPYVKNIKQELVRYAKDFESRGLKVVAISSNDVDNYPDDSPEKMKEDVEAFGYPFPYLYDETQEVAKKYKAACTPDFFLFDENLELAYRGQFDSSRPGNGVKPTGEDLREATNKMLSGKPVPEDQIPSVGCNIKWKKGNEPEYFG
ncbi:thioredoxin family protein [Rhodohalobacter sp. SW132]|uniref:thioredoxin family protein n=1 Tax=Rhodohalobacter sp. SW132 TaxID=2293433 RepID=UPI000E26D6C7|nr:thioredoxin family protein [Rhodohalobacter sp. SW132]REL33414.1 thioredoxin family protein [Rhodohalobacter sp. SW132]